MPPDIRTGPMTLAAGMPPGRASGLTPAGPPGSDPLAALFASLLAHSDGPPPAMGVAAPSSPKVALKPNSLSPPGLVPAKDKAQENKPGTAPLIPPPLLTPLQMRPFQMTPLLPPTAGMTVGQKTTEQKTTEKTMDTSLVPTSPSKKASEIGGELPLQDTRIAVSGAVALFPILQIASLTPPVVPLAAPSQPTLASPLPPLQGAPVAVGTLAMLPMLPMLPQVMSVAAVQAPPALPLKVVTRGVTMAKELTVTDGLTAMDGKAATDGKTATDGEMLMVGRTSKTGLKSAVVSADTITRSQSASAKTLPADLGLQVIGRRSERRVENVGHDALPALSIPVPAQVEAARTEAKPLSAADRAEVIRQAADGVGALPLPAKAGTSEQMTLQLHPKEWGQLQVSVTVAPGPTAGAAQTVTAHIVAQNPQVKAALENQSGDLRQALREAGLHLDKISVTVQRMEAGAQAGMAASGGRHEAGHGGADQGRAGQGMDGAFEEMTPNQKTGMSGETRMLETTRTSEGTRMSEGTGMSGALGNGMSSMASGGSSGGRHGGESPPSYRGAYITPELEDAAPMETARRSTTGQIDMRA